jgi:hypothetical protein
MKRVAMPATVAMLAATQAVATPTHDVGRDEAELGWNAYLHHDLDQAEVLTRVALEHTQDPAVRGAALYNLGLIRQDRGDTAGAIAAYEQSLQARLDPVVRGRLATLDPAAASALDPYHPTAMDGPFPSLAAACDHEIRLVGFPDEDLARELESCDGVTSLTPEAAVNVAAPFDDVQVVKFTDVRDSQIAVEVAGAWYVRAIDPLDDSGHCGAQARFERVEMHGTTAAVTYVAEGDCSHRDQAWDWMERGVVAIGVGSSGAPSATRAITVRQLGHAAEGDNPRPVTSDVTLVLGWDRDGFDVEVTRSTGMWAFDGAGDPAKAVAGHHALAFR